MLAVWKAVSRGGGYFDSIRHDSDLASLRGLPRFEKLPGDMHDRDAPEPLAGG